MSVRFDINTPKLENNHAIIEWLQEFAAVCLKEAHLLSATRVHGGTGDYQRGFAFDLKGGNPPKLIFGNTTGHAGYIEFGTEPHDILPNKKIITITPKNAKALHWQSGGESVFAKSAQIQSPLRWFSPPGGGEGSAVFSQKVHHPGTKAQHIVRDAVTAAGDRLRAS